ncbi:MAG: arylesterase [Geminicoccaceae bacterium]
MARQMVRGMWSLKVGLALAITALASVPTANAACRIAVLGDSLTTAHGLALEDGFPAQLQDRLRAAGHECEVLDAGVAGDTSAGGRARLDWMLADRPTHVIVELGGNDALRALPAEQMAANLDAIVTRLQAEGVAVLLAGMRAPPNLGRTYGDAFEAVFSRLAERHGVPLYPFFLDGVAGKAELNQPDGIHPTAAGIEIIVERILPTVTDWLERTG